VNQTDKEKYIGIVKWFHDQTKNANYGFIEHAKLGELFFHERSIEQGQDINSFIQNAIVVFVAQESRKHKGKLEAVDVKYLDTETDLNFLFNHFLSILTEKGKYSDYNTIQKGVHSKITSLLEKITDTKIVEKLFDRYLKYVISQLQTELNSNEEYLKGLLKICRSFFFDKYKQIAVLIEKFISTELAHNLWLDSLIETCQIDFIANNIFLETQQTLRTIFGKCSDEDKLNILFKVLYNFENIDTEPKLKVIKDLLKISKEFAVEQHEKILTAIINVCSDYFKLNLWLEDYHESLDFNSYKLHTITLSPTDQKKFVKKVLKYIHEEKAVISIDDLTSLNVIDFELSKLAEKVDEFHLDYSTSVILNVIHELNNKIKLDTKKEATDAQHRIYDLIIKQIKEPKDILQITGFFDECEGRCNVSVNEIQNESGEITDRIYIYQRNVHSKPNLHFICDGRKAINKVTNEPSLSEEGAEFWWCANQKCFKPSRELHTSDSWEKYSLLDFLTILKVQYNQKDYEIYLNLINKANRFLHHLKCRNCQHILRPVKDSNYAFYGVNDFHCTNENCEEQGKKIYLTHCLNGFCDQAIDSRDVVRCKPDGFESEKCGWYVCNYCHSCCSDEGIGRRVYILERTGQQYKCHTKGHRNLGVISCNKCGSPMDDNKKNQEEYDKVLKWFIANRENADYIAKHGQTKNGKWWFRFKKHNLTHDEFYLKLTNLLKLGFNIPNFDKFEREVQLVSESDSNNESESKIYICSNKNCEHILDLSTDLEKAWVINRYHNVRFKQS